MTKKDLQEYRHLMTDIRILKERIRIQKRKAEEVPIVKDKVQSSMKEFPYLPTHETTDAPEPKRYTAIMRDLYELRKKEAEVEEALLRLDQFILSVPESRDRMILMARYVDGLKLTEVASKFGLTEQGVLKIINKILDEFNTV